mgnify:CR=1 FL=1
MLNFRSVADLAWTVSARLHRIPADIDLVVGIPRSGLFAAWYIALARNVEVTDLPSFLAGTWSQDGGAAHGGRASRKILLVDDAVTRGETMRAAMNAVAAQSPTTAVVRLAAYAEATEHPDVDMVLERCPTPRVFEWNLHRGAWVAASCYDMDGVLCRDPSSEEDDDGGRYRSFLAGVEPLVLPTGRIRKVVTSRLERYRPATEDWLARHGVDYDELVMLDLPTAADRRRFAISADFKASVFNEDAGAALFVESNTAQAAVIAQTARKPVFDYAGRRLIQPHAAARRSPSPRPTTGGRAVSRLLPEAVKQRVKRLVS